jgi:hypothetical protein
MVKPPQQIRTSVIGLENTTPGMTKMSTASIINTTLYSTGEGIHDRKKNTSKS